jgi:hypothetical protein
VSFVSFFCSFFSFLTFYFTSNTYTNKTWSEVSGIELEEINRMEREFLLGVDFNLYVDKPTYEAWLNLLKGLVWAKERDCRRVANGVGRGRHQQQHVRGRERERAVTSQSRRRVTRRREAQARRVVYLQHLRRRRQQRRRRRLDIPATRTRLRTAHHRVFVRVRHLRQRGAVFKARRLERIIGLLIRSSKRTCMRRTTLLWAHRRCPRRIQLWM